MKKNKKFIAQPILFIILSLIILFSIFIFVIKFKNNSECKSDSGCVLQETTCCPCNMGGKQECMSKDNSENWKEKLKECDKNIMCIAVYNCKEIECGCSFGKCKEK
ncbi:MAG: hypothetical protein ABIG37_03700 [Nanoarchaeota archaeon]|nr:hypothetical protein [Nanoarchaeota archaeon]